MKRFLSSALPPTILMALSVWAFLQVADNAPAFSPELRSDSVFGDWRAVPRASLYRKSEYYLHLGHAYLFGDVATVMTGEESMVSEELFRDRIERSRALFQATLAAEPGQAEAWTSLAWVRLLSEDFEGAREALETSWALAPFNASQSTDRLPLLAALDRNAAAGEPSGPDHSAMALRDLQVVERYRRQYFLLFTLSESAFVERLLATRGE